MIKTVTIELEPITCCDSKSYESKKVEGIFWYSSECRDSFDRDVEEWEKDIPQAELKNFHAYLKVQHKRAAAIWSYPEVKID